VQTTVVTYISSQLSDAIIFALLFIALLVRPTGLFRGLRTPARVARS
jgi:branched-chain amino acid transport system permease protein